MSAPNPIPTAPVLEMLDVAAGSPQGSSGPVVEHINWQVQAGDYWVVAGLQGSGKSDFLMMASGVTAPLRGDYWLFGQQMPIFDPGRLQHRLRLGLVFDGGQLFQHLTVRENIALPLCYHHNLSPEEAAPQVEAMLQATELSDLADRTPGGLARSWQKRTGLARALVLQPEVLLLDGPLTGLDHRHVRWWLRFLDGLWHGHPLLGGRPLTLVATTADLRPWKHHGQQFAQLKEGRLTTLGTWQEVERAGPELMRELWMAEERPHPGD